ncbi:NAD(P)/FAD-dependent oxidoreductase [Bacillus tuaregi]|uniref:NAD(P)/FAD-dependent oxidoreductase n=1 Tax=Bacillus tuaregi TaxID=1816695 RepID=UPI0008F8345A|nr:FAD-binding oxidoreductase [Bacillus tuaregi]
MKKIVVVGAGILGASTAYQLAKEGAQVIIVDRKDKGQATDAAAGIVCPWLSQRRNKAWYELAKAGARFYPGLIDDLEKDGEKSTGYSRVGAICLHTDEKKLEKMAERAYNRRQDAPEIGDILLQSSQETKRLFPLLDDYRSLYVSGGARVDGRALRDSLLRAAQRHGAVLIYDEAKLLFDGTRVHGVETSQEKITADTVIVCTGAWAPQLLAPLGVNMKVRFQKAQIAHLKTHENNAGTWPVVMPPGTLYLLAFDDNRIVAGSTHEDTALFDTRVTAGGLSEIFTKALETAPGLSETTLLEARVGFRPFTPGFLPVIGPLPGWKGILFANGLGSSGLTVGPFLGSELAKLALGRQLEIDIEQYSVEGALAE